MCSMASTPTAYDMSISLALQAASLQPYSLQPRQLVQPVERRRLVALGQRRVVEHRIDEVVDRSAERHHGLTDVNQFGRALADDVHAQHRLGLTVENHLQSSRGVAPDLP